MLSLQDYGSSSSDEESNSAETNAQSLSDIHLKPVENSEFSVKKQLQVCAAPVVLPTVSIKTILYKQIYIECIDWYIIYFVLFILGLRRMHATYRSSIKGIMPQS